MAYKSLEHCLLDLEKHGQLLRIKSEVDPNLEMAEIQRQVYAEGGPALLFEKVKGSPFRAASNIYGTFDRTAFIFRNTLDRLKKVIALKKDPTALLKSPTKYLGSPLTALKALPRKVHNAPVLSSSTTIDQLPQIISWPMDGGAFVTLPQVMTLPPGDRNMMHSNVGMYRIQLSGNEYIQNEEIGLHYQLHRGIGIHHQLYNESDEPFRVSIAVGGPPSHAFAAIMPMPEGLSELTFAGMLGGRRFRYLWRNGYAISADADFVISGTVKKNLKKPEGPFGDHLGYYSLEHEFPVLEVAHVYHRKNPIWHFTVVGRPPQEDTSFGWLIHELVQPLTEQEFPGIRQIHAVDEAGVHPLLLAIGSERYMPFRKKKPEEILTQAHHLLGKGQTSLAKFLFIADGNDYPDLNSHHVPSFFNHFLERIDLSRDLHFHTRTTIDTLDYSGSGWNEGSKLVVACCGEKIRTLKTELPSDFKLSESFRELAWVGPGILAISGPLFQDPSGYEHNKLLAKALEPFTDYFEKHVPFIVLVDDANFTANNYSNYLWEVFTRTNPSHDVYGIKEWIENKHWSCSGAMIFDARTKPHHAPELKSGKQLAAKVKALLDDLRE